MQDLIGTFRRIEMAYRLYIRSAFPLRYEALSRKRDELLRRPGVL